MTETKKPESPLYALLNEINHAATHGMPFLAISMAVALPAICASLEMPGGRSHGPEYKDWCKRNLTGEEFDYLTPDDLYSMRCGVLHSGRFGDLKHSVARVIFLPAGSIVGAVNCTLGDAYFYSVEDFCRNMTRAVFKWFEANRENPTIQANIPQLMQYREGFAPYVGANALVLA